MEKRRDSLLFKFSLIFFVFTVGTLSVNGIRTYKNQTTSYQKDCERNITNICDYLETLIMADAKNFVQFQKWWTNHLDDVLIPLDFSGDWTVARQEFGDIFAEFYPGKSLGRDISFEELDFEVQKAWATWQFEYWLHTFEEARESFSVIYTYYTFPTGDDKHLFWMIDAAREGFPEEDERTKGMMDILDDYFDEKLDFYPKMREAWETGKKPSGFDVFDNEYGKTFAYYVPLVIEGRTMGIIGTEIEVDKVNKEILIQTFMQMIWSAVILITAVIATLIFIYKNYISKLVFLNESIKKYAINKDSSIAGEIERHTHGKNEISDLSNQVSEMILEIENYIRSLFKTTRELTDTKKLAVKMNELANKDALTGIRNKLAYDCELNRLSLQLEEGKTDFGIAMIDLNFLKRINDTYGHEQGNKAIQKLCHIVCNVFQHSPVFRIGGDEFVVILENGDLKNIKDLLEEFFLIMKMESLKPESEPWERISAAIGVAIFSPEKDETAEDVFKRADKEMYANKKEQKAMRE